MQSTPNLRDTDPHDMFVIEPDASLVARADKALAEKRPVSDRLVLELIDAEGELRNPG